MESTRILIAGFERDSINDLKKQVSDCGYEHIKGVLFDKTNEEVILEFQPDILFLDPVSKIDSELLVKATSIRERFQIPIILLLDVGDEYLQHCSMGLHVCTTFRSKNNQRLQRVERKKNFI